MDAVSEQEVRQPSALADSERHRIMNDLSRQTYCILGIPIDAIDMSAAIRRIARAAMSAEPFVLSTPNVNFLINSQRDERFRDSLVMSDLCPPDGSPLIWIFRLLGAPIRHRVAGSDIFERLKARRGENQTLTVFFFGSTAAVAQKAARRLNLSKQSLRCVGWACPGFGTIDELSKDDLIGAINDSKADFLVVALGAKRGQEWLLRNHTRLRVPVRSHLGATINFQAGTVRRAPVVWRKLGLEWLWRIKEEPALFERYWADGRSLLWLVVSRIVPLAASMRLLAMRSRFSRLPFQIDSAQHQDCHIVSISGYATEAEVSRSLAVFGQVIESGRTVNVDLSKAKAIDIRFFGLLLMVAKQLKTKATRLVFTGAAPKLKRLFWLNGLAYLLRS